MDGSYWSDGRRERYNLLTYDVCIISVHQLEQFETQLVKFFPVFTCIKMRLIVANTLLVETENKTATTIIQYSSDYSNLD